MSSPKQIRNVQTQIIATLGPASSTYETIRGLYEAGVDFFRLNFSHGEYDFHREKVEIIRRLEQEAGRPIGIIADLQGPKLRIGTFKNGSIVLSKGMRIRFDLDPTPGDETRVSFPHADILAALEPKAQFLMDDGNIAMEIVEKGDGYVVAEVQSGTSLSNRKGVNVPDLSVPVPSLTEKDRNDLAFALSMGVDWIAQSFVQSGMDVAEAKKLINGKAKLIAKIEKPAAVKSYRDILEQADAVMVARGDLGVEVAFEKVPALQKFLTHAAHAARKPVIIATQMLDSMRENPRPTRAEVSDVAQAVLDGASAVMLSGETAMGKYPVQSVEAMDKICQEMEKGSIYSLTTQGAVNKAVPLNYRSNTPEPVRKKFPAMAPK